MRSKNSQNLSFQNSTFFSIFFFIVSGLCSFQSAAQTATIVNARHETIDQRTVQVLFDNTIQAGASINGWSVTIGGIAVTVNSVTVLGTRVNVRFDATVVNGVPFILTAQSAAGVRVSYNNAAAGANTLTAGSGNPVNSFTNVVSQNNFVFDCSELIFFQQGIYPGATADICAPVSMDFFQFQYKLSLRFRNSTTYNLGNMLYAINWGDATATDALPYQSDLLGAGAPTFVDAAGFTGSNPAIILTARPTHLYPATTTPAPDICSWDALLTPYYNGVATCFSLATTRAFATYDTDNANSGVLNLPASIANTDRVCLGNNVNMRFSDNTLLNCRVGAPEAGLPNDLARWIRVVYGSQNLANNIPDIRVGGFPVTADNAAGTLLVPGGYFPTGGGGVGVPDFQGVIQLATPVNASTLTAFMQQITTVSALNHVVGDRFYVRLEYWDICNPYNPGDLSNRVSIENYIEIITKPTPPVAVNKEYCFTEVFASGGNCGAPTGEFFELTAGSVSTSTEVKWYNTLADATGDVNEIASTYGTNCRFLRPENRTGGVGAMAAAGVYPVFARYRIGVAVPNNCLSDPIQVTITRRSALTPPGVINPLSSDVCDGTNNVPFSLPAAAPVVAIGGATEYSWTFSGGAGATVDAPTNTQNITADFNIGGAFTTATRSLDVVTQFTTNATTGGNCSVGPSQRTVTIYGPTLGGTASGGAVYCEGNDATNISLAGHRGTILRWEVSFNAGAFADAGVGTGTTFDPGVLPVGDYEYRAVIANGPCAQQNSTTTTINVSASPTPALVGANQNLCLVAPLISNPLGGSNPAPGTGLWTKVSGPGTVTFNPTANTPNATATVSLNGVYVFRWTVTNPPCTSQADITVDYGTDPGPQDAGDDTNFCGLAGTLPGPNPTAPTVGSIVWTQVAGPAGGTTVFGTPNAFNTTVTPNILGAYTYRITVTSGTCSGQTDDVIITFNPPATVQNVADFSTCVDGAILAPIPLSGTFGGGAGDAHWERVAGSGTFTSNGTATGAIDNSSPATDSYTPTAADFTTGSVQVRLVTNDPAGACPSVNDPVTITFDKRPSIINAGVDFEVCAQIAGPHTATLAGSAPDNSGDGAWSGPAGVSFGTATSPTSTVSGLAIGPNTLTWTVNSDLGLCGAQTDQVIVTVNPLPVSNAIVPIVCEDIIHVVGSPSVGTGQATNVDLTQFSALLADVPGAPIEVPAGFEVLYFQGPGPVTPITTPTTITPGEPIFTRVRNIATGCFTDRTINFTVRLQPVPANFSVQICEDNPPGSLVASGINLTSFEATVAGGIVANRNVEWYTDNTLTTLIPPGALPNQEQNYSITATTTLFAKIIDTTPGTPGCNSVAELRLVYQSRPNPNTIRDGAGVAIGASYTVCASNNLVFLQIDPSINPGSTYTWNVPASPPLPADPGYFELLTGTNGFFIILRFPSLIPSPGLPISVTETLGTAGCAGTTITTSVIVEGSPPAPVITGPPTVCANSPVTYSVPFVAGDTYSWTVPPGATITSFPITNTINVQMSVFNGNVTVTVANSTGCVGPPSTPLAVTVVTKPTMTSPTTNILCSGQAPDDVHTLSATLGGTTYRWEIISISGFVGGASVGDTDGSVVGSNTPGAATIDTRTLTNTSGVNAAVIYRVTPVSPPTAGVFCEGNPQNVTITIQPEPSLLLTPKTVCSDEPANYEIKLATVGLPTGTQFTWAAPVMSDASVQGTSGTNVPAGASGTIHINDAFVNTTAGPITATYTIAAISAAGCSSNQPVASREVVITINPKPLVSTTLDKAVCSDEALALTLNTEPGSTAAGTYNIVSRTIAGGLTADPGNATVPQPNVAANYLFTDKFTNTSGGPLLVTYLVNARGGAGMGACQGPDQLITITINPGPATNPVTDEVCSDVAGGDAYVEDLTSLQPLVNANGALTFEWYTDAAATLSIATPTAYPLQDGVPVYVKVHNGVGTCAKIQAVEYVVNPTPAVTASITSNYNGSDVRCVSSADGVITADLATLGSPNYTYSIDGSTFFTGRIFNGLSTTGNPYTVTVRDARGCTATAAPLTLIAPAALTGVASVTSNYNGAQISCNGASNGTITVIGAGGTLVTTYQYSIIELPSNVTGATSGVFTGLGAGTYTFVVRDANNCSFTTPTVTITAPSVVSATGLVTTPVTCNGNSDGVITVTATGGTVAGTYTFTLIQAPFTVNTTGVFSGLPAGTYRVNVSDDNSCLVPSNFITVTQPSALTAFASVTSNYNGAKISCPGANDAVITAIVNGGNGGFTYVLVESPGNITGNATGIYTGVGPGTYTVSVTDAQLCNVVTVPVNITDPTPLNASGVVSSVISCNGGSDGEIRLSSTGGTGAYTFTMTSPAGPTNATGIFSGLPQGTYDFEVRDLNNCTDVVQVILGQPIAVTASALTQTPYNGSQISCNGASDGIITVTASGGTGALTYVFDQFPANLTGMTTGVFTGVPPGVGYTFTVRDSKGCPQPTGFVTAPVNVVQPPVIAAAGAVTSNYNGQHITCPTATDGIITVTASGGTGVLTYRLDQAPLNLTGAASGIFTGVGAGSYTITVRDANSCFRVTVPVAVIPPPGVNASAAVTSNYNGRQITCNGASDGILTVTAGGGVTPYSYVLNEILGNVTGAASGIFTGLPAGTYTVTVRDLNNCPVITLPVTISDPTVVSGTSNITSNYNGQQIRCVGASDGIIRVTGSGGTAPYTFISIEVPGNVTGAATGIFTGLPAGSYTFTVRDINNCTFLTPAVVISPPIPLNASALVTSNYHGSQISCFGADDGTITVTATGGTGALNYVFVEDPTNTTGATSGVFIGIGAGGPYTFLVTDANTCNVTTVGVSISEPAVIAASAAITSNYNGQHISCPTSTDGVITVTASGGTGVYTYRLDQAPLNTTGNSTGIYSNVGAGTYTVTVRDENGCFIVTTSVTVVPPPPVTATAAVTSNYNGRQISCNGISDGILTVTAGGGVGLYTYVLNQIPANITGATTGVFTGLPAGPYTVDVRDGNNCLVTTTSITITQPAVLGANRAVTSNYNGQQISCNGASDGIITVTVSGGTGPFAYTSVEVSGNITGASSGIFTGLPAGSYTFNITDVNSCGTTTAPITISAPALMVATLSVTPLPGLNGRHVSCAGASDGSITVNVTVAGTGASTFTIDQIPANASGRFSGVFTGIPPGFYTVTLRDANNCTIVTNSVTVDPTPPIIANAAVTKNVNCFAEANGVITVTASGGTGSLEYLLIQDASNLTGAASGVFTGLRAGNYTVRVTDDNTCFVTTTSVTVTQPANLTITIAKMSPYNGFDLSCSGASDGEIRVTTTAGGAGPYTYALDGFPANTTGATSGIFTGLSAGLYTVTVTDNNTGDPFGPCTRQSFPVFINNPVPLAVNLVGFNKQICIGDDPTTITQIANPVGGIGIYTYQWQDSIVGGVYTNIAGAISATFDPPAITQTTYYRRLLSSGSCATLASDPVEVKVNPLPEVANVTAPAFLCENSAMIVFYDFAPGQAPFYLSYTVETIDQSGVVTGTRVVKSEISGDSKPIIQSPFIDDVRITIDSLRDFNRCKATVLPAQVFVEVLKNSAAFTATAATQCTGSAFTVQWNANPEVQYTFKWTEGPDAVFGPGLTGPQSDSRVLNSFNTTGIQTLPIILTATNTLHLSNPAAPDCGVTTHLENIRIFPTIIPNIVVIEDKLCSGSAVQVTNSTSGGDFHTWTITRTNDGVVEAGFPITDNSALNKSFVINNTSVFNPATYEIRYDISNDPALGNGNCSNSTSVMVDVYTEIIAKIGSPKDPAQTIQRWGESDPGDAGVMGVDGGGKNFMRINFGNASTPVPPAAGIEYTWVFSNNNANTPPETFVTNANPFFYDYKNPGVGKRANLTVTNLAAIGNVPGGCSDTDQFIFEIEIPPIVADFRVSRSMICLSDTITVANLSTPLFNVWSIVNESTGGIPMTSNAFEPIFSLTEAGRYRISLKVRNPDFPDEDAFYTHATDQFVDAYDKPDASFITSPFPNVFVPDQELKTDNRSQTAFDPITDTFWPISYEWDFGDGRVEVSGNNPSISDPNSFHSPVHQYKTESQYIIYLTAYNDHPIDNPIIRCSSRDSVIINARAGGTTKVPNAFTPNPGGPTGGIVDDNGTTINDVFLPITKGVQEFKMQIFDRWGNLIFESNNRNQGWDGYDRNGNLVPAGVYVYKLVLRMSNDVRTTQVGDVTLIR